MAAASGPWIVVRIAEKRQSPVTIGTHTPQFALANLFCLVQNSHIHESVLPGCGSEMPG